MSDLIVQAKIEELAALLELDTGLRRNFERAIAKVFRDAGHQVSRDVLDDIQITSTSNTFAATVMAGPEGNP